MAANQHWSGWLNHALNRSLFGQPTQTNMSFLESLESRAMLSVGLSQVDLSAEAPSPTSSAVVLTQPMPTQAAHSDGSMVMALAEEEPDVDNFYRFGKLTPTGPSSLLVFQDWDGTIVTLRLTGPGYGELSQYNEQFIIELYDTTLASNFTITTLNSGRDGDDGRFSLMLLATGPYYQPASDISLGSIVAPTTDITGRINIGRDIRQITLGHFDGGDIILGGYNYESNVPIKNRTAVNLTLGSMMGARLDSELPINQLQVREWVGGWWNGGYSELQAPSINSFTVQGDCLIDILLASDQILAEQRILGSIRVGGLSGGNWHFYGSVGSIQLGHILNLRLEATGSINSLTTGNANYLQVYSEQRINTISLGDVDLLKLFSSQINVFSARRIGEGEVGGFTIGSITAQSWMYGVINADKLDRLTITGRTGANPIRGDFGANLYVGWGADDEFNPVSVLGSVTIQGNLLTNSEWKIRGSATSVTIKGIIGNLEWASFDLYSNGHLGTLNLGDVENAAIRVLGKINTLTAQRWLKGNIDALSIDRLNITGRTGIGAFSGDFHATLSLGPGYYNPEVALTQVLGTATISGDVGAVRWELTGNLGILTIQGQVGADIIEGGEFSLGVSGFINSLVLGDVLHAEVSTVKHIGTIRAKRWQYGWIDAAQINSLTTTGQTGPQGYEGDFQADLTIRSWDWETWVFMAGKKLLGSANIHGKLSGNWDIRGNVGTIDVKGRVGSHDSGENEWFTLRMGDINNTIVLENGVPLTYRLDALRLGDVHDAVIEVGGVIGSITAGRWIRGSIEAHRLDSLQITGKAGPQGYEGVFAADIELRPPYFGEGSPPVQQTLGTVNINGHLEASSWEVGGKISSLRVTGRVGDQRTDGLDYIQYFGLGGWQGIGTLTLGDVVDAEINVLGDINTITARRWSAGKLQAHKVQSINITGLAGSQGYTGDFVGRLLLGDRTITQQPEYQGNYTCLGNLIVQGDCRLYNNDEWPFSGNVGSIQIQGDLEFTDLRVSGNLGSMTVGSNIRSSQVDIYGNMGNFTVKGLYEESGLSSFNLGAVTMGDVVESSLNIWDSILSITAKRWNQGWISAQSIGSIRITGQTGAGGYQGDFLARLDVGYNGWGNPPSASFPTIRSIHIHGDTKRYYWDIDGPISSVVILGRDHSVETEDGGEGFSGVIYS